MYNKRSFAVMPNILGGFFEDVMNHNWNNTNDELKTSSVPVNVMETEKNYELHVVAPGLKKEDFKLAIEKQLLTISFDHKEETTEKQEGKWIRNEFRQRSFKRSFTLTDKIDATQIAAKYADGILTITLPKKEPVAPEVHEIAVN